MAPISDIERQKFTEIYETYSGKLYGVCLHYFHSPATAEDLLHDSFIVIFSSLENLRDHSRLEPWMYSIVRNIAYKHLRSSGSYCWRYVRNFSSPERCHFPRRPSVHLPYPGTKFERNLFHRSQSKIIKDHYLR